MAGSDYSSPRAPGPVPMQVLTLPSLPIVEEAGLVDRLHRADLDAIREVYDRYHRTVGDFACRLLGDPVAAEDLLQEVFILLPKVAHRLKPGTSLVSFLLGIAANRARHHLRSRARRRRMMARWVEEPQPSPETPEARIERHLLARVLARALDALPLRQRIVFVLCEIEERPGREVAEILRIPEGTVRTRLFHARRKLGLYLEREGIL
jgi:RNA polymerase sigma-70 factor, ECF subfamily